MGKKKKISHCYHVSRAHLKSGSSYTLAHLIAQQPFILKMDLVRLSLRNSHLLGCSQNLAPGLGGSTLSCLHRGESEGQFGSRQCALTPAFLSTESQRWRWNQQLCAQERISLETLGSQVLLSSEKAKHFQTGRVSAPIRCRPSDIKTALLLTANQTFSNKHLGAITTQNGSSHNSEVCT